MKITQPRTELNYRQLVTNAPATGVSSDPSTTGSPGGSTDVSASLTELYALVAAAGAGFLDWVIVTDPTYGAVGDGTTDDTAAIAAAIAACPTWGTVYFPIGVYRITSTLTVGNHIRFLGGSGYPGYGSVIKMTANNTTAISTSGIYYMTFENMEIANTGSNASGRGVYALSTVEMIASAIDGFYDGLFIDGVSGASYFSHIDKSHFTNCARAGIYLDGKVNNIRINGLRCSSNAYGIYASGGIEGATISDSDFEDNTTAGILWDGTGSSQTADSLLISGGWFDNNGPANISIGPTTLVQGVTVDQCFFEINSPVGSYDLDVNYCDRLIVSGSHFKATSGAGSIRCDASNTTNVTLINVKAADTVTTPASTKITDPATSVTPASTGSANSAGTSKYDAAADHVHVGTIAGVTVSGTPTSGQVPTATSGSAATWQTPTASSSGSTDHLHINDITYSGDGSTLAFELPAAPFDAWSVTAYVAGTRTEVTLSGALLTTMTFGSAPASATDNIKVDLVATAA